MRGNRGDRVSRSRKGKQKLRIADHPQSVVNSDMVVVACGSSGTCRNILAIFFNT